MSSKSVESRTKIMAVASGGGHWVQLLRICKAFDECEVVFVTVHEAYRSQVGRSEFYSVRDANRRQPLRLLMTAWQLLGIIRKERPQVIVSTGAAPGYLALRFARLIGARTIWLESIANAEHLSMSGRKIGPYADLWLTQWPALARPEGPVYAGSVL
ncbi:UDP-N-acetylglucosamine--LPS N-acetylglucosamine transferase [Methylobacterium sp. C25]|nr:UDP-N-acetylglucosamine--LPS N-acetylglucosamine transferase [Methylobacterium sp. C25]